VTKTAIFLGILAPPSQWRSGIKKESKRSRINEEIDVGTCRLIGAEGEQVGIVPLAQALETAKEAKLDLVEIAPDADPVVCKILDYGKFIFEAKKDKAAAKKKQRKTQVKEMKFRPGTEEGDYQVKLRNLTRFLNDGDKAKVTLRFRGREMAHQELGMELLKRIEVDLAEISAVELHPKMEGRQLTMVLAPRGKKKGEQAAS
jgi:translation initiation factor IF-3